MSGWSRNRNFIQEYPYKGVITRIVEGEGMEEDTEVVIYDGEMDEHMITPETGSVLQTSSYIISIPLTKNENDEYIIPDKGDCIEIDVYGKKFTLTVDNAEPSQLGGVSIYATRNSWNKKAAQKEQEVEEENTEDED